MAERSIVERPSADSYTAEGHILAERYIVEGITIVERAMAEKFRADHL